MATRYTGKSVAITFDAGTAHFQEISIDVERSTWEAPSSDADVDQGGMGRMKASITIKGWDIGNETATDGLSFAALATLVETAAAPSAFTWTDTATTPASRLPADFFTNFPLAQMRVSKVSGGSGDANKAAEWTATIVTNRID